MVTKENRITVMLFLGENKINNITKQYNTDKEKKIMPRIQNGFPKVKMHTTAGQGIDRVKTAPEDANKMKMKNMLKQTELLQEICKKLNELIYLAKNSKLFSE
jgi:hypothetical protein